DLLLTAVADDLQRRLRAYRRARHLALQNRRVLDRVALIGHDHIPLLDPSPLGRAVLSDAAHQCPLGLLEAERLGEVLRQFLDGDAQDRKSTRLNSSHLVISYAVFCLKKKKKKQN